MLHSTSLDNARDTSNESSRCEETFRPSFILQVFCFHWFVSIALFTAGLYLTLKPLANCTGYYLIVYLQIGFWIGTYTITDLIKPACRKMLRQDFRLYRRLSTYRKRPLQIVSGWNTILIATQQYVSSHHDQIKLAAGEACGSDWSAPQVFIVAFSGLQALSLTLFYVSVLVNLSGVICRKESKEFGTRLTRSIGLGEVLTIEEQLMQCAEQIKDIQQDKDLLRREAKKLGIADVQ